MILVRDLLEFLFALVLAFLWRLTFSWKITHPAKALILHLNSIEKQAKLSADLGPELHPLLHPKLFRKIVKSCEKGRSYQEVKSQLQCGGITGSCMLLPYSHLTDPAEVKAANGQILLMLWLQASLSREIRCSKSLLCHVPIQLGRLEYPN